MCVVWTFLAVPACVMCVKLQQGPLSPGGWLEKQQGCPPSAVLIDWFLIFIKIAFVGFFCEESKGERPSDSAPVCVQPGRDVTCMQRPESHHPPHHNHKYKQHLSKGTIFHHPYNVGDEKKWFFKFTFCSIPGWVYTRMLQSIHS
jgi:hypothetical protein